MSAGMERRTRPATQSCARLPKALSEFVKTGVKEFRMMYPD